MQIIYNLLISSVKEFEKLLENLLIHELNVYFGWRSRVHEEEETTRFGIDSYCVLLRLLMDKCLLIIYISRERRCAAGKRCVDPSTQHEKLRRLQRGTRRATTAFPSRSTDLGRSLAAMGDSALKPPYGCTEAAARLSSGAIGAAEAAMVR